MKNILIVTLVAVFGLSTAGSVYASDWDKAGKALTVIEGLRVLTGGKVDVVGSVTGINKRDEKKYVFYNKRKYPNRLCSSRTWVPKYVWERKYIPKHEEYNKRYGKTIVDGHYISYMVERGGHWSHNYYCG